MVSFSILIGGNDAVQQEAFTVWSKEDRMPPIHSYWHPAAELELTPFGCNFSKQGFLFDPFPMVRRYGPDIFRTHRPRNFYLSCYQATLNRPVC